MKKILSIFVAVLILVGLVGCAASENTDQSGAAPTAQNQVTRLTVEQVQAIALEHAGYRTDQVMWVQVEYELDDGIPEYSVEFIQSGRKYEYTIHAETGEILGFDQENEPTVPTTAAPAETEPAVVIPEEKPAATEPVKAKLSREEARDIALKHAGVELSQIKGLEIEYDVDDGVPEYSVEFRVDGWELDYEIHAQTGKIIEHHKERD